MLFRDNPKTPFQSHFFLLIGSSSSFRKARRPSPVTGCRTFFKAKLRFFSPSSVSIRTNNLCLVYNLTASVVVFIGPGKLTTSIKTSKKKLTELADIILAAYMYLSSHRPASMGPQSMWTKTARSTRRPSPSSLSILCIIRQQL